MQLTTLRQQAYEQLRNKLIDGELIGGEPLSEPSLARELGMSRTPVREAIRQMEMEGLLEYAPRFGTVVRIPDETELADLYGVREALESYAATVAAERISEQELMHLEGLLAKMSDCIESFRVSGETVMQSGLLQKFLAADLAFHKGVISASGNEYISKLLDTTGLLMRVFFSTHWHYDAVSLAEANQFHEDLLKALRAHDAEAARCCTVSAMEVARANALRALDKS
jgi:DNA-binding GntR family transcriptional regulator